MSSRVRLPQGILTDLKRKLMDKRIDFKQEFRFFMRKKDLLGLNWATIEFLKKHTKKPLDKILRDKKYNDSYSVEFYVPIKEFMEVGILRKEKRGGDTYWVLQHKILDPRKHVRLYLLSEETTRTLMKVLGYLDVYEKYRDKFEIEHGKFRPNFAKIVLDDIEIEVSPYYMRVLEVYSIPIRHGEMLYNSSVKIEYFLPKNPKAEDVEKTKRNLHIIKFLVEETLLNFLSYAKREIGDDIELCRDTSTKVIVDKHRISYFHVEAKVRLRGDRSREVYLWVEFDKNEKKASSIIENPPPIPLTSGVSITVARQGRLMNSKYLEDSIVWISSGIPKEYDDYFINLSATYREQYKFDRSGMKFVFVESIKGSLLPPGIRRIYHVLGNLRDPILVNYLKRKIWDDIKSHMDDKVFMDSEGRTVTTRDLLGFIKWRDGQSLDETLFKLAVIGLTLQDKLEVDIGDYDLASRLIILATLDGHSENKVFLAVNHPRITLIDLIRKGKLKIILGKKEPKIMFKGKDITNVLSPQHYTRGLEIVKKTVQILIGITTPRKELEKIKKYYGYSTGNRTTALTV